MKNEILYRDDNLLLEYVSEGNYLHETWQGITPRTIFFKLVHIIIKALEEKQADGLILDAREHCGLMPEDQELAAKLHDEYAQKHGLLKQAIIIPKDVYSKYSVENYSEKFEGRSYSDIHFFIDVSSAEDWLKGK